MASTTSAVEQRRRPAWHIVLLLALFTLATVLPILAGGRLLGLKAPSMGSAIQDAWHFIGGVVLAAGVLLFLLGVAALVMMRRSSWRMYPVLREWLGRDGFANIDDLRRSMLARPVRRTARKVRPSLAFRWTDMGSWSIDPRETGGRVGWTVTGPLVPRRLYCSPTNAQAIYGPPQSGKSQYLIEKIITSPGAVLATSTKTDLYEASQRERSWLGPVYTLNCEGLGGVETTLPFTPLVGCSDPSKAHARATWMMDGSGGAQGATDANIWEDSATSVLKSLLLAAALSGQPMSAVGGWAADPSTRMPLNILEAHRGAGVPENWIRGLAALWSSDNSRTRDSVYFTLRNALKFLDNEDIARMVARADAGEAFDMEKALQDNATIYLIGADSSNNLAAPLLTAFVSYLFDEARRLAAQTPGRRLDPWLSLILDEVALITPVPLDRWLSDSAGRGIHIAYGAQSPSQIVDRYGEHPAHTIDQATNMSIYYGGYKYDVADRISRECGEGRFEHASSTAGTTGESETSARRRTITPEKVRELPEGVVVIIERSTKPVIAYVDRRYNKAAHRSAVRWAQRTAKRRGMLGIASPAPAETEKSAGPNAQVGAKPETWTPSSEGWQR